MASKSENLQLLTPKTEQTMAETGSQYGILSGSAPPTSPSRQIFTFKDMLRPCLAELICVWIFVFVGTMSVTSGSIVAIALAHGLTIAVLVACFGHISGAHINPAVTLAVTLGGGVNPIVAIFYVISQLVGSLVGAGCCRGVLSYTVSNVSHTIAYEKIIGGTFALGDGVGPGQGFFCEFMLTTILAFTVLMTAVDTKGSTVIAPLAIGFSLLVSILAGANISGAALNPARAFGPAVVMTTLNRGVWNYHYIYWVGPLAGALLAAFWFRILFADSDRRIICKED